LAPSIIVRLMATWSCRRGRTFTMRTRTPMRRLMFLASTFTRDAFTAIGAGLTEAGIIGFAGTTAVGVVKIQTCKRPP
jgi:hypothetical protein